MAAFLDPRFRGGDNLQTPLPNLFRRASPRARPSASPLVEDENEMNAVGRQAIGKRPGLALLLAAALVTATTTQESAAESPTLSAGQKFAEQGGGAIYANVCAACHQADAKGAVGAGAYPALAGNSNLASADYVLRVVIRGQRGMPPLGGMMSDEQAADVVNYVRSHFGNDYRDTVSAAAVQSARPPSR